MSAPVAAPPRSRRRRLLRWAVGLFALAVLMFGGMCGWLAWRHYRAAVTLAEAIAETNRLDPGWAIADIEAKREVVPDERNSAQRVLALKPFIPANFPDGDDAQTLSKLDPPIRLTAAQRSALARLLKPVTPERTQAREIANFPNGRLPISYARGFIAAASRSPDVQPALCLLEYDLLDLLEAGDTPAAVSSWRALFHTSRAIGDEPLIVSQMTRAQTRSTAAQLLERLLAQSEPDALTLVSLQQLIEDDERQPLFLFAMRGERAGGFESIEMVRATGAAKSLGQQIEGVVRPVWEGNLTLEETLAMLPGAIPAQEAALLTAMTELVEIAKLPPQEQGPRLDAWTTASQRLPALARMLASPCEKLGNLFRYSHAELRFAIMALAAERFRRTNGRWPMAADELVTAGILKALPVDPYGGEPLQLRRTADGISVEMKGLKHPPAGDDHHFQLWDVPHRRKPPP
jgi:hypothetical protein